MDGVILKIYDVFFCGPHGLCPTKKDNEAGSLIDQRAYGLCPTTTKLKSKKRIV
jgi:hypothetical protein